jgi:competence protein ComGC
MKKVITILMTTILLLLFIPSQLKADEDSDKTPTSVVSDVESAKISALEVRLNEIKAMDIPALSSTEKKELRKEVRSIKGELKTISKSDSKSPANSEAKDRGNGVYLSVGAIIIIVLLLILLL